MGSKGEWLAVAAVLFAYLCNLLGVSNLGVVVVEPKLDPMRPYPSDAAPLVALELGHRQQCFYQLVDLGLIGLQIFSLTLELAGSF